LHPHPKNDSMVTADMVFAGDSGLDPPAGPGDPAAPTKLFHRADTAKSGANLELGLGLGPVFQEEKLPYLDNPAYQDMTPCQDAKLDRRPSASKIPDVITLAEEAVPGGTVVAGQAAMAPSSLAADRSAPVAHESRAAVPSQQLPLPHGGRMASSDLLGGFQPGSTSSAPMPEWPSPAQARVPSSNVPRVLAHRPPSSRLPSLTRVGDDDVSSGSSALAKIAVSDRCVWHAGRACGKGMW
jgi:hypothetical protein